MATSGRYLPLTVLLFLATISAAGAGEVFVSPNGHDVDADGSEERPFLRIQAAIDNAWDYDVILLVPGRHVSDGEIRFRRRKLTVRGARSPGLLPQRLNSASHPGARAARATDAHRGLLAGAHCGPGTSPIRKRPPP